MSTKRSLANCIRLNQHQTIDPDCNWTDAPLHNCKQSTTNSRRYSPTTLRLLFPYISEMGKFIKFCVGNSKVPPLNDSHVITRRDVWRKRDTDCQAHPQSLCRRNGFHCVLIYVFLVLQSSCAKFDFNCTTNSTAIRENSFILHLLGRDISFLDFYRNLIIIENCKFNCHQTNHNYFTLFTSAAAVGARWIASMTKCISPIERRMRNSFISNESSSIINYYIILYVSFVFDKR